MTITISEMRKFIDAEHILTDEEKQQVETYLVLKRKIVETKKKSYEQSKEILFEAMSYAERLEVF